MVYADTSGHTGRTVGRGLRALGRGQSGKAKGRSQVDWKLRPMIEADAPSTEEVLWLYRVRAPPGVVMVAPPALLRNAEGTQSEGRANHEWERMKTARPRTV